MHIMKKFLSLLMLLSFLTIKAAAYEWTDDNGVTWTFSQESITIDGESQDLWAITEVKNYGEEVVFPEVVYNDTIACTVEALVPMYQGYYPGYNYFWGDQSRISSVTLPATIKYIEYNAFNFYACTVTLQGSTPPVLGVSENLWSYRPNFSAGVTILVPDAAVATYRNADVWSNYALRIISQSAKTNYKVFVAAEANGSGIHTVIGEDELINVMSLKVTGTINSYDIMIMRNKMHNLHHLDLTDASVVANSYEYYDTYHSTNNAIGDYAFYGMVKLMTVKLPKTIKSIGTYAFRGCSGLRTVEFQDGLETIGTFAFHDCTSLQAISTKKGLLEIGLEAFVGSGIKSVDIEECTTIESSAFRGCSTETVNIGACTTIGRSAFESCSSMKSLTIGECKTIGYGAFSSCGNLVSVSLPDGLQTIGGAAFSYCYSLSSITIPVGVISIGYNAFSDCSKLAAVAFPNTLKTIGEFAFGKCTSLTTISLPTSLTRIEDSTFGGCTSLVELHIPPSINTIGNYAFSGCSALKDIYTYTIEPTTINQDTFSCWTTATLHVPYFAYNNYYWDTWWSKFAYLDQFNDTYEYDYFYINNDFVFSDQSGVVQGIPDADLNAGSGLIVETTNEQLELGDVHLQDNGTASGSIIANNNLTVENLFFDMDVTANKWYFLSLPFRVKMENVTTPGDYVFRYYDGETRATSGTGGWQNYTGEYLQAHTGYIFQTNTAGKLTFKVEQADMNFSATERQNTMSIHVASDPKNASWNFMGNPFPSYYDIDDTGYEAPITVWSGSSYTAVRPGDDQYHLGPFQAFFVQKPEDVPQMTFPTSGCHTYKQWADRVAGKTNAPRRAAMQKDRWLVNLTIGMDEAIDDRTRVVFNDKKSVGYELDCDAAKFFSSEQVAQLYSLDDQQTCYAINERPVGEVTLGYVAPQSGMLTIAAERMDQPVLLYDKKMNIWHDLATGGYVFSTEAGTFNSRFVLVLNGSATAIEGVNGSKESGHKAEWYDLQGRSLDGNVNGNGNGVYVRKQGDKTTKVTMK